MKWHAFKDKEPPTAARLDNPGITGHNLVLVTNNLSARDAMGHMSHVWLAMPFRLTSAAEIEENGGREWIGDLNHGSVTIACVTHWADPFEVEQEVPDTALSHPFAAWMKRAYRDETVFSLYNMEVAYTAGRNREAMNNASEPSRVRLAKAALDHMEENGCGGFDLVENGVRVIAGEQTSVRTLMGEYTSATARAAQRTALIDAVESAISAGPMDPVHAFDRHSWGNAWHMEAPPEPREDHMVLQGRTSCAIRAVDAMLTLLGKG